MSEKESLGRATPPDGDDDHRRIWDAVDKSEKMWIVTGPIYAVVSNWKPLVIAGGILMALNGAEIIAFLSSLSGVNL